MGSSNPIKKPKVAKPPKPEPVAPIVTRENENVKEAVGNERRRQANMEGRSQQSLLNPVEAQEDEKDLLG